MKNIRDKIKEFDEKNDDYETVTLTVYDLLEILHECDDPRNTLVVLESRNQWHDCNGVSTNTINYRKCVCLTPSMKGVTRPAETLRKEIEKDEIY